MVKPYHKTQPVYVTFVNRILFIKIPDKPYFFRTNTPDTPLMLQAYATGFSFLATSPSAASTSMIISSPASTFPERISFAESVSTVF